MLVHIYNIYGMDVMVGVVHGPDYEDLHVFYNDKHLESLGWLPYTFETDDDIILRAKQLIADEDPLMVMM